MTPLYPSELLTLKQACDLLQCHPNTLREWDRKGVLKAVRFGPRKDRRYKKIDILRLTQPSLKEEDVPRINIYGFKPTSKEELPLYNTAVSAGFPSPADDFIDKTLDLNELMVDHPAATFFVKVDGDSMVDAGIQSGDMLVVDRSLKVDHGKVVIAVLNGEFTVKRMMKKGKKMFLMPENAEYKPVEVTEEMAFDVWGVVKHVVHSF